MRDIVLMAEARACAMFRRGGEQISAPIEADRNSQPGPRRWYGPFHGSALTHFT
jgi:hypothetical protein